MDRTEQDCRICSSSAQRVGGTFDYFNAPTHVWQCELCGVKFVPIDVAPQMYDQLYSSGDLGYHHDELKDNLPLDELMRKDMNFIAVAHNLPPPPLDILEIGCGYGHLTNALNLLGYRARGIDVSGTALAYAKKIYGDYFKQTDTSEVSGSYGMIIGIEVIEHVPDPAGFIRKCAELLKPNGRLILTTPNKDFYSKKVIWMTNPPPVHLYWFGKKTMEVMAKDAGLIMEVLPSHKYHMEYDTVNLLANWLKYRNQTIGVFKPAPFESSHTRSLLRSIVLFKPIREISNFIYSLRRDTKALMVMMIKPS